MSINGVQHGPDAEGKELHSGDLLTCGSTILNIFIRPPPPKQKAKAHKPKVAAVKDPTGQTRQLVLDYKKYVFTMPGRAFEQ